MPTRSVFAAIVLCACSLSFAEKRIGLMFSLETDPRITLSDQSLSGVGRSVYRQTNVSARLYYGRPVGPRTESRPLVYWSYSSLYSSLELDTAGQSQPMVPSNTNSLYQHALGLGWGLYYCAIPGDPLRLLLGPELSVGFPLREIKEKDGKRQELYAEYFSIEVWAGIPINLDIALSKRIGISLASRILSLRYTYTSELAVDLPPETKPQTNIVVAFGAATSWIPSMSLYLRY